MPSSPHVRSGPADVLAAAVCILMCHAHTGVIPPHNHPFYLCLMHPHGAPCTVKCLLPLPALMCSQGAPTNMLAAAVCFLMCHERTGVIPPQNHSFPPAPMCSQGASAEVLAAAAAAQHAVKQATGAKAKANSKPPTTPQPQQVQQARAAAFAAVAAVASPSAITALPAPRSSMPPMPSSKLLQKAMLAAGVRAGQPAGAAAAPSAAHAGTLLMQQLQSSNGVPTPSHQQQVGPKKEAAGVALGGSLHSGTCRLPPYLYAVQGRAHSSFLGRALALLLGRSHACQWSLADCRAIAIPVSEYLCIGMVQPNIAAGLQAAAAPGANAHVPVLAEDTVVIGGDGDADGVNDSASSDAMRPLMPCAL